MNSLPTYKEGEYEAFNSGGVEKEVGEFLYGMVRILKPLNILDLGTHKGISAAYMAKGCKDNKKGIVHTVEFDFNHWNDADSLWKAEEVQKYVVQYKTRVDNFVIDLQYDLIFIDTEPDQRWGQLVRFYPNLSLGGYVFLHDLPRGFCKGNINPDHPEFQDWPWGPVPETIKELLKDRELVPFHFPNPREMCGFYKKHPGDYYV